VIIEVGTEAEKRGQREGVLGVEGNTRAERRRIRVYTDELSLRNYYRHRVLSLPDLPAFGNEQPFSNISHHAWLLWSLSA